MSLPRDLCCLLLAIGTAASASLTSGCIGVSAKRAKVGVPGGPPPAKVCITGTRAAEDGALDDFEDTNNQISVAGGRDGYWWSAHDDKGSTLEPIPFAPSEGGADGSEMAMHAFGKSATSGEAFVELGANLVSQGVVYDASRYAGIAFKARVDEKSTRNVRVKLGDVNTHKDGGICKTCWNHFGKDLTLTPKWKEYRVMFSDMRQEPGWGEKQAALTVGKLVSLSFSVKPGQAYDVWIDDVYFLDCK